MSAPVVVNQPGVYLVDIDGNVISADDGTTISDHEGILIAGKDGTVLRFMRVASDGTLRIDPTGTTVQPVSVPSLPLPAGAATEATLVTLATETKLEAVRLLLASLDSKDYATQTTLAALLAAFGAEDFATETTLAALRTDFNAEDFATETKLEAVRVLLVSLDAKDYATQTTLAAFLAAFGAEDFATETTLSSLETQQTDGSQVAQSIGDVAHDAADSGVPVKIGGAATAALPTAVDEGDRVQASFDLQGQLRTSGSVNLEGDSADLDSGAGTDDHGVIAIGLPGAGGHVVGGTATDPIRTDTTGTTTQPVSAAALPLPTGASTAALQTQPGVDIGDVTVNNAAGAAAVNIQDGGNSITVDGPLTDTELRATAVPVSAASLPLPAGAATAASQLADGHNVTVDNAAGASAVNIQDGGNSITVDAASLPLPTGAATEATLASLAAEDFATETTLASLETQQTDGSQVSQAIGDVAHDAADSGDPVKIGGAATAALPTAVDEGDRVQASFDLQGQMRVAGEMNLEGDPADLDTTAGTDNHSVMAIGLPGSGGHVVGGTAADPLRMDPTGTTTQPVSASSLPLPTGASTAALQTQPGVDIGDVTVNNAAGAAAVNIQDGGNSITVDGPLTDTELRATAVPVSAAALPLPSGAATAALQTQPGVDIGDVTINNAAAGAAVNIQDGGNSITVDAASLPLPTGAATEATLASLAAEDFATETTLALLAAEDFATETTLAAADAKLGTIDSVLDSIKDTDGIKKITDALPAGTNVIGKTTTRSGAKGTSVAADITSNPIDANTEALHVDGSSVTQPVSAASLPLPSGAATAALQTQPGVDIGDVTVNNAAGAAAVNIQDGGNSITVDGPLTDTELRATAVPVSATALPLPTGAATSANQLPDGHNVTVDNAAGAAAVNVQDGGNSITVDGPLTDTELRATPVPVSGTVTADAGTGPWPVTDNGGSLTVDGPLTDTELRATAVPVSAAALPLPTGAATAALQTQPGVDIGDVTVNNAAGASAVNIQDGGNSITVDGPLTDTELRATAVPVSAAALPLPAGAATSANQLADGHNVTVDNAAGAAAVNIQDGGNSITVDATSLPLPTGAATEATLATRLADATFTGRINTQGQKAMAASTPVVIASDQSDLVVEETKSSTTAVTNVTGATGNTTVLAANSSRLGATVQNDANKNMLLKLGATASATSYTVLIGSGNYYEVPFGYTGILDAVWAAGVSGDARVTEFTA